MTPTIRPIRRAVLWDCGSPSANLPIQQILTPQFFRDAGEPCANDEEFVAAVFAHLEKFYMVRHTSFHPSRHEINVFIMLKREFAHHLNAKA